MTADQRLELRSIMDRVNLARPYMEATEGIYKLLCATLEVKMVNEALLDEFQTMLVPPQRMHGEDYEEVCALKGLDINDPLVEEIFKDFASELWMIIMHRVNIHHAQERFIKAYENSKQEFYDFIIDYQSGYVRKGLGLVTADAIADAIRKNFKIKF